MQSHTFPTFDLDIASRVAASASCMMWKYITNNIEKYILDKELLFIKIGYIFQLNITWLEK